VDRWCYNKEYSSFSHTYYQSDNTLHQAITLYINRQSNTKLIFDYVIIFLAVESLFNISKRSRIRRVKELVEILSDVTCINMTHKVLIEAIY
jgi:hypothetical protein